MPSPASVLSQISFAEYADTRRLSSLLKAGFEAHVRQSRGNFNYATSDEWDALYRTFTTADRRRRG